MFSRVYWNQPVCPSVRPSVHKHYFLSKRWRGYQVTFSDNSGFPRLVMTLFAVTRIRIQDRSQRLDITVVFNTLEEITVENG